MKNERLGRFFSSSKADALLLHNGDAAGSLDPNCFYFTGLSLDNSILVARRNGASSLLCTPLNYGLARKHAKGLKVLKLERQTLPTVLRRLLSGCKKVGINARSLRVSAYSKFRKAGKKFIDISDSLGENRAVKEAPELATMKKCVNETKDIFDALEVKPGITEFGILQELRMRALEKGLEPSFPPIVASGPNTGVPHSIPTSRRVGRNEVVMVDFGLEMGGYCSDLTRCYFTGPCKKERKIYETLMDVQQSLAGCAHAGLPISELVMKAEAHMKRAGLPFMPHALGHGIGLEVHEQPYLYAKSRQKLQEGMVLALEPSFYCQKFGVRYENDFVVEKQKARML